MAADTRTGAARLEVEGKTLELDVLGATDGTTGSRWRR
jgi:hypothetical protein